MRRSPHSVATILLIVVLTALSLHAPAAQAADTSARRATFVQVYAPPTSIATGAVYAARVRVTGASRPVRLERKVATGWRSVASTRTAAGTGRATLRWKAPTQAGRVLLRVVAPRTPRLAAAATRGWAVAVKPRLQLPTVDLAPLLRQVLNLVNVARAVPRTCGDVRFDAARPLTIEAHLTRAADDFAELMATRDFFSHSSPDGSDPGDRITAAGYQWRAYGENIAAGYSEAGAVVQGWIESPGHCKNLMNPGFRHVGLGHAYDAGSRYGSYWVQDFGIPR
ncbi:MAG: hypothetical protein JWN84_851 [Nocardioides sp.]|jgi:uncharacterized protein YkwD|nr:hypothetical protein [Nocardioides sp.]